ncbi:MAG: sulfatase-like hydrolase/transferase, partial [Acidobacteriota bacterium]
PLLACSKTPQSPGDLVTATRWIDGEAEALVTDSLYDVVSRGRWPWGSREGSLPIAAERSAGERYEGDGLYLQPVGNHAVIVSEVEIDADRADVLRLHVKPEDGLRSVFLLWAGPGEAFSGQRKLTAKRLDLGAATLDFEVGEHELWRGSIDRLRLILWGLNEMGLESLETLELKLDEQRLQDAASKPWKVAVENDRRVVRMLLPDAPVERRGVEVVRGTRVSFGYAAHRRNKREFPLRLVGAAEGREEVLWSAALEAAAPAWREADVDLSSFAGASLNLRFEVDPQDRFGEDTALPLIAHPKVLQPAETEPPPNVVLIVLDTLRPDRLSLYGYGRETSPNLDAWAERRGAIFTRVVSQAGWTLPAHASLFSSLDPQRHGLFEEEPMPGELATLTTELARRGYATRAATGGAYLDYHYGFDRGFDSYRTWRDSGRKHDEPVVGIERTLADLEVLRDQPFFLFFHTYAVHGPYKAWQPHFGEMSDLPDDVEVRAYDASEDGRLRRGMQRVIEGRGEPIPEEWSELASDQYDSGIARLDVLLKPLLEALDDPEIARRTVVVVTSDHGEMFGEHGYYDHGYLWDQNLLVPLIIAEPEGRGAGVRVDRQVRLTDVTPTILELTGSPALPEIDGASLVPLLEGRDEAPPQVAWSYGGRFEHGLSARYRDRYKLIVHDSPWAPFRGGEQVWEVDTPDGIERRLETMPEELGRLGDLARRQLAATLPGLRLKIRNPTDRELRGTVEGQPVTLQTLKTPLVGCECLEWQKPGFAELRIPPGQELFMIMTSVRVPKLGLSLAAEGLPAFRQAVDLPAISGGVVIEPNDGVWRVGEAPSGGRAAAAESAAPTAEIWWHQLSESAGSVAVEDSEVLEQLRALGYVD